MKILRKILSRFFPVIPVALVLAGVMVSPSCANTTTPPSGGKKDTIPPSIIGLKPLPGTTGVPVKNTQIVVEFNEYFTIKDSKGIFLSPPQARSPKYKIKGKSLVITFEEDLLENTTYTLDLGGIQDNNEGNKFPGYTLTFSTGDTLDSMVVTGTVRDCNTLMPVKGATVLLYKDHADSAAFLHRPDAAAKTDEWGFYSLRNVKDTLYRIYAIIDESGNNIYDPDNDRIGFVDSLIRPTMVVSDTLKELLKYDMKDTVNCMARISEHEINVFREKPSKQLIVNKKRNSDRYGYITFMAPGAQIDSLWIKNVQSRRLILQMNPERDSLEIWVNDRRKMPDTLHVFVDYMKTDTAGVLSPFVEQVSLVAEKNSSTSKSSRRNIRHEDTTCVFKLTVNPETVEQYGFQFEFDYPIVTEAFDSLKLTSINPRQQEAEMKYTVTRDSTNLRKYTLMPSEKLQSGYEYKLKVPYRKFRDINGFYNDSTEAKVSLPKDDKLSSLTLNLSDVNHTYIVDLLNEKRDKVLRSYHIKSDCTLDFPYLKKGKYSIRMTEDLNDNGIVDTGDVLTHRQPEKVKFYKLRDGSYIINVMESAEMEQAINVAELFED
ncbi:MAG: Ig-like domain-containing protein [Bacteroidales bacterium]|nr:Ig-like domain-containing protein [Bacteroidales bacterium]